MRRLPLFAALIVVALAGASAWLAIDAQSEPEDGQAQQAESPPDDSQPEQQPAQQADAPEPQAASAGEAPEQAESARSVLPLPLDPLEVVIAALDLGPPVWQDDAPPRRLYVVQEGDTLAEIAASQRMTLAELLSANPLLNPDHIEVGQELVLHRVDPAQPDSYFPYQVLPHSHDLATFAGTLEDVELETTNSAIVVVEDTHPHVWFVRACVDGMRRIYLVGAAPADGLVRVYWRVDDGPLRTDRWFAGNGLLESSRVEPLRWDLFSAEALWLRAGGVDWRFDVTPVSYTETEINWQNCSR